MREEKKDKKPAAQNYYASPEQIAQIRASLRNIEQLVYQVNRPISMISSMSATLILIHGLFLHEKSPFYETHQQFHNQFKEKSLNKVIDFEEMEIARNAHNQFAEDFNGILSMTSNGLRFLEEQGGMPTYEDALQLIADVNSIKYSSIRTKLEKMAVTISDALLKQAKYLPALKSDLIKTAMNLRDHATTASLDQLFKGIRELINLNRDFYDMQMHVADDITTVRANADMNIYIQGIKLILTMGFQYFVVDHVTYKLFPNGFLQPIIPKPNHFSLTHNEAIDAIKKLQMHEASLTAIANRNVKYSRIASPVFAAFSLYILICLSNPSSELMVLSLTLIATALTNSLKDFSAYKARRFHDNLVKERTQLWENILEDKGIVNLIKPDKNANTANSYFVFHFNKKYAGLSDKTIASIFEQCCLEYNIEVSQDRNTLTLPLVTSVNAEKFKKRFLSQIERRSLLQKYKKQMNNLVVNRFSWFATNIYDKASLPSYEIEIHLSKKERDILGNVLSLFKDAGNAVHEEEIIENGNEEKISVTIHGFNPIDPIVFKKALLKVENETRSIALPKEENSSDYYIWQAMLNSQQNIPKNKVQTAKKHAEEINKNKENQNKKEVDLNPDENHTREIKWKSGKHYHSDSSDSNIHPVVMSAKKTKAAVNKTNLFVTSELERVPAEIKDTIDVHIKDAKIVPPKGQQGLVQCHKRVHDQNGKQFTATWKLKLLGANGKGDVRVYFDTETNGKETLLVAKAIKYHTHIRS